MSSHTVLPKTEMLLPLYDHLYKYMCSNNHIPKHLDGSLH